jgi:hypothetical protein
MNTDMQGNNHGGKNHLLGMIGIGAVVLVALLVAGRSFRESLPLAAVLACPLMMIGMMFMMRGGNSHQHNDDSSIDHGSHQAPQETAGADPSEPLRRTAFTGISSPKTPTERSRRP